MAISYWLFAAAYAVNFVHGQYPPPITHVYEIASPINPNILVRFKTPDARICNTTNPNQKQYSGYIHLPPHTLAPIQQDYNINTFFWFFEARENPETAPLTIWLNGGPGSSSMIGLMQEMGPCEVVPADKDHLHTIPREFGWDRSSNMLFIDQPNQVGFSYDTATNGVLPMLSPNNRFIPGAYAPPDGGGFMQVDLNDPNSIATAMQRTNLRNGTFSSGNMTHTANTTEIAAEAMYHFLQAWMTYFPQYYPRTQGLNMIAESYGGKYGPTFFAYIEKQNVLLKQGKLPKQVKELHLESLGIVNGCIDDLIQAPYYPIYGNTNPYNITAISHNTSARALEAFFARGGCKDKIEECRRLLQEEDPYSFGDSAIVNLACKKAEDFCGRTQMSPYFAAGRSVYDIAHTDPDPFPPSYYLEFLNNATVQQALGVPVNFTQSTRYVYRAFDNTGDMVRGGETRRIAYLLESGVRVGLIYGDRDYICNYLGGEAVSLAIDYKDKANFASAGYEDIQVNSSYIGGQVRQYGNFSFSRVYQAGHLVPAYQPEAAFTIFNRFIHGRSIATGQQIVTSGPNTYSSKGKPYTNTGLYPPPPPPPKCFVRAITSCTKKQFAILAAGKGLIRNSVLYNTTGEYESVNLVSYIEGALAQAIEQTAENIDPHWIGGKEESPAAEINEETESENKSDGASLGQK